MNERQRLNRPREALVPNPKLRFLEQCRQVMRLKQLALRSEQAYLDWIKRFILFHRGRGTSDKASPMLPGGWRHPRDMGAAEVRQFLTYLASERAVAASTQNQALNALVFLYREVLGRELEFLGGFERASRPRKVPVVLSRDETQRFLSAVPEKHRLFFQMLYGTGLRLMEGLRLRVKDVDLGRNQIVVHDGKGFKDRVTMLPDRLKADLERHLERVRWLHALKKHER